MKNVPAAHVSGDRLIIELDAALARSYRTMNRYSPPRETSPAWLEINLAGLDPDAPNLIPRRYLHEGSPPFVDVAGFDKVPVLDLRRFRIPQREARLKRIAQRYPVAVVQFGNSEEMTELYNTYLLIVQQRPERGVVHVHRVEPETVPTDPHKAWLAALPFAAVYDVVIAFPASVILTVVSSANVWVIY